MKKIIDLLSELESPYREQAIENITMKHGVRILNEYSNQAPHQILSSYFVWHTSKQGRDYWEKYHNMVENRY